MMRGGGSHLGAVPIGFGAVTITRAMRSSAAVVPIVLQS
jgi:hypothetical protein